MLFCCKRIRFFLAILALSFSLSSASTPLKKVRLGSLTAPQSYAADECARILTGYAELLWNYLEQSADEYQALFYRVVDKGGVKQADFDLIISKLLHTFQGHRARIEGTPYYDGKFAASRFLRGVTIWAESYDDIERAVEQFYLLDRSHAHLTDAPKDDLALAYFAARMAWVADQYDRGAKAGNREWTLERLDDFDETMSNELHTHYDVDTGRVTVRTPARRMLLRLEEKGIRIYGPLPSDPQPETSTNPNTGVTVELIQPTNSNETFEIPVLDYPISTKRELKFNNGRLFSFFSLPKSLVWVAQQLAKQYPKEYVLGLDDTSVRQFFHLFRVENGRMSKLPYAADFLSIRWSSAASEFVLRELKFANPHNPNVDIAHALRQLLSSWVGLSAVYSPDIEVRELEIVLPKRVARLNGSLGNGYRLGKTKPGGSRVLLKDGVPVTLYCKNRMLEVTVRELPLTDDLYRRLRPE